MTIKQTMDEIKVLLIDDDEEEFTLARAMLGKVEHLKYSIDWCADPQKAVEKIVPGEHDVYLIDYNLGATTGLDLIKTVLSKGCKGPFILITGQGDHDIDMEAMKLGVSDYLNKGEITKAILERSIRYAIAQKKVEGEAIKAKEIAENATKLKDKFVALVSHDLRGPIGNIKCALEFMSDADDDELSVENREELSRNLIKTAGELIETIDSLLDVSRLQSGNVELSRTSFDTRDLICSQLKNFEGLAAGKGVSLANNIPENITLFGDRILIGEVIKNLISNALKFCSDGDSVKVYMAENPDTIIVEDSGGGICDAIIRDLFKHDVKTSTNGTAGERGTGLGLPYCRDIMDIHGGKLSVESIEGKGSSFYMKLPSPPKDELMDEAADELEE